MYKLKQSHVIDAGQHCSSRPCHTGLSNLSLHGYNRDGFAVAVAAQERERCTYGIIMPLSTIQ
jgi:hypothetical protein